MSIKTIEADIKEYAAIAGKDIEHAYEEVKQFITGKKVEAQNVKAAASGESSLAGASASPSTPVAGVPASVKAGA